MTFGISLPEITAVMRAAAVTRRSLSAGLALAVALGLGISANPLWADQSGTVIAPETASRSGFNLRRTPR